LAAVAVDVAEVKARPDLHRRYHIDSVPIVVVADAEGVVRTSFTGPPSATDLWAAVAGVRETGGEGTAEAVARPPDRHASGAGMYQPGRRLPVSVRSSEPNSSLSGTASSATPASGSAARANSVNSSSARIPADTEVLAGLELGGVPVATALSLSTGVPTAFVRKEAKTYGTAKLAEGAEIAGRRVLIVEDIVTTGGQVVLSARDLRERGAILLGALCVIDRSGGAHQLAGENVELISLFTADDLG